MQPPGGGRVPPNFWAPSLVPPQLYAKSVKNLLTCTHRVSMCLDVSRHIVKQAPVNDRLKPKICAFFNLIAEFLSFYLRSVLVSRNAGVANNRVSCWLLIHTFLGVTSELLTSALYSVADPGGARPPPAVQRGGPKHLQIFLILPL